MSHDLKDLKHKKLKKTRKDLDLTQADVAEKVGIDTNHYAKIERGEVITSLPTLESILKVLKLKFSDVLP